MIPSLAQPPFSCPPDITLDLPVPPSVNRSRKIDWSAVSKVNAWKKHADALILLSRRGGHVPFARRYARFELHIVLSEFHTKVELDNALKTLIDYLRRIEVIENDAPKNMRKITVEWGYAPEGARVTVRPTA